MNATDRAQTVADAALLPASMRETMIRVYLELAEANHALGLHDLADYADGRADALTYGGSLTLQELTS